MARAATVIPPPVTIFSVASPQSQLLLELKCWWWKGEWLSVVGVLAGRADGAVVQSVDASTNIWTSPHVNIPMVQYIILEKNDILVPD